MSQTTPSVLSCKALQHTTLDDQVWTRSAHRPRLAPPAGRKRWSRYERLSFSMLLYSWGILILVVTWLFFSNSHLETKTSSTSGSHSNFYMSNPSPTAQEPSPDNTSPDGETQ